MRYRVILLWMLIAAMAPANAQVSIGIGFPNVSIGINLPIYPELAPVPGYPVYYAPQVNSNYFFYDGMYWVFQGDNWYASSWYNGPWAIVSPMVVPVFVLRIPVRYYSHPPAYFRGWQRDAPPRWGDHWGNDWQRQRSGWDHWNRNSAPAPAPLPSYQRQYSRDRYPSVEQQRALVGQHYHYQPHDPVVQQHYQQYAAPRAPSHSQQRQPQQHEPGQPQRQQPVPQPHHQQAAPQPQHQQQSPQPQHQQQSPQPQHQQQHHPAPPQQPPGHEHGSQGQGKGEQPEHSDRK